MQKSKNLLSRFLHDDNGATAVEYGILVAILSISLIGVFATMGDSISSTLGRDEGGVAATLNSATGE
jgi:pilus assembly protein Flp/PilA